MVKFFLFLSLETAKEAALVVDNIDSASALLDNLVQFLATKLYVTPYQRLQKYATLYQFNVNIVSG